jgi:uncharacterized damage-inducible protein DinB
MITRIWHGRTAQNNAEDYLSFLRTKGISGYRQTAGNLSVKVGYQNKNEICHFWTITEWKDLDSIKSFAGNDFSRAVYYPEDEGVLLEKEEHVENFETIVVSGNRVKEFIRQLNELFEGGSWQGESVKDKLATVNENNAFLQPIPGVHSVAEIVWHCIYWRTTLLKNAAGELNYRDSTMESLNFLPLEELKQRGWEELKRNYFSTQEQILQLLNDREESFLDEEYKPGKSFAHLVEGVIRHDLYHLGQIGLVQKLQKEVGNGKAEM